jgi:hypothetical protein
MKKKTKNNNVSYRDMIRNQQLMSFDENKKEEEKEEEE